MWTRHHRLRHYHSTIVLQYSSTSCHVRELSEHAATLVIGKILGAVLKNNSESLNSYSKEHFLLSIILILILMHAPILMRSVLSLFLSGGVHSDVIE